MTDKIGHEIIFLSIRSGSIAAMPTLIVGAKAMEYKIIFKNILTVSFASSTRPNETFFP
mgnify:CR=1 FL=1